MKVLVTGGSGMVGRNFLEHPAAKELEILAPSSRELDLRCFDKILAYLSAAQPDLVIHMAGTVGGIQANIQEPVRFLVDNLDMGRNLVMAAREAGIRKFINLGSSCMYPRDVERPLTEDMVLTGELEPTNEGYALAKIVTARLCEYISRETPQFSYKTLIPCNLYGRWDKFDPAHSHLIAAVIHKLHQAKEDGSGQVAIWGDGMARREFLYAADFAEFLHQAVRRFDDLPALMNVGWGRDHTIREYYETIRDVVGCQVEFTFDLTKPVGMKQKLTDVSRLKAWGWQPLTSLREGLAAAYQYYLQYHAVR